MVDINEARYWLRSWSKRIIPANFQILGGETTLHPDLKDFIYLAHEVWPTSKRVIITNGIKATKIRKLKDIFWETNTGIEISFHSLDPTYLQMLRPSIEMFLEWGASDKPINITILNSVYFTRFHRGVGYNMRPFKENDPKTSWDNCGTRACMPIVNGRLWKCPPIAGLSSALAKLDLLQNPEWQPYLNYHGLGLDASDEELWAFLKKNAGPEAICGMCPTHGELYQKDVFSSVDKHAPLERAEAEGKHQGSMHQFIQDVKRSLEADNPDASRS